jgi:ABC-2 type transport system permease protein
MNGVTKFRQSVSRIRHLLTKEFIQTLRDPHTRWILIGPPIVQMLIFGYAATLEVKHVGMAVLDRDNTQESRELVASFTGSRYFSIQKYASDRDELRDGIDRGDFLVAVEINAGFAQRMRKGQGASVEVLVDSSNSNTALISLGYIGQIGQEFTQRYESDATRRATPQTISFVPQIALESRPWFNAGLVSQWYFVPGVIGNLMLIMVMMLTAYAVVREREIGTLEQIMVTPVRRWEFILGKTIPFFLIGCVDTTMISLIGTFWFGVPFRGSVAVLASGIVIFLFAALGLGLLISTISKTQQQAMIAAFFFTMPAVTLSGFGTPVSSMPESFQRISYINPLRHVLVILRGVYLKGVGFDVLWPHMVVMAALAVILLTVSVLRFRKSFE